MRRFTDLLQRFRRDENGAFAVIFALMAIVLIATSGAVVDFTYTQTARSRAQTALDAAALALQARITIDDNATLISKAQTILNERIGDGAITGTVNAATVDAALGKLNLQASITVPTAFVQLVGVRSITAQLTSEVVRGSKNLEISVALDTTGSMGGSKIAALITSTNNLIDLVVQPVQTPTYSKMAIVPWTQAVNVGTYATAVRGPVTGPTTITGATWMNGTSMTISGITTANPAVVTTSSTHGFSAGDYVFISNVSGMTQLNNKIYKVGTVSSTTNFQLLNTNGTNVNSSLWSSFSSSGSPKVTRCLNASCEVLITTSAPHGHVTGDTVYISGVSGMTVLNATHPTAVGAVPSTTTYYLSDETAASVLYATYNNGGSSYCTKYGCTYYYFQNAWGGHNLYQVNNCATERTAHSFDDTAPSANRLSYNYLSGGGDCIGQTILPLTSDKTALHSMANSLVAANSTGGHLGLAWGWYMLAPNFGYLWPAASQPAAYTAPNLIKAVILMTDGQFNVQYCNGVLSQDSANGMGSQKINCNAPDGTSHDQAVALCNAIKAPANNTLLYTVGFDLGGDTASLDFLRDCATDTAHFFQADSASDLDNAFTAIAQSLNKLRISR